MPLKLIYIDRPVEKTCHLTGLFREFTSLCFGPYLCVNGNTNAQFSKVISNVWISK